MPERRPKARTKKESPERPKTWINVDEVQQDYRPQQIKEANPFVRKPEVSVAEGYADRGRQKQSTIVGEQIDTDPKKAKAMAERYKRFVSGNPDIKDVPFTREGVEKWNKEHPDLGNPSYYELMLSRDIAEMLEHDESRRAKMESVQYAGKAEPVTPEEAAPQLPESLPDPRLPLTGSPNNELFSNMREGGEREPLDEYEPAPPPLFNREHWEDNHARSEAYKEKKKIEQVDALAREGYINFVDAPATGETISSKMTPESKQEWVKKLEDTIGKINRGDYSGLEQPKKPEAEDEPNPSKEYLDYYDNRDNKEPKKEPEGEPDPSKEYLDYYDNRDEKEPEAQKGGVANAPLEKEPFRFVGLHGEKATEELAEYLTSRSQEPEKQAEALGPKEASYIRKIGERYNKINWKYKLAFGAGLIGGGWALTSLMPLIATGIASQRLLGMTGMFVKFEDHLQRTSEGTQHGRFANMEWYKKLAERPEQQRKIMAAVMAVGYTAGMSALIGGAIHVGREALASDDWADSVREWVNSHWPFYSHPEPIAVNEIMGPPAPEAPAIPEPAPITEGAAMSVAPNMPDISVDASPGHGYEYMIKRIWEQMQSHSDPNMYAHDSDIHRLLTADKSTIDQVVHKIATEHGFYNPDGTSVLIDPHAHLNLAPDGQLHFSDPTHPDINHAPTGAHVTPPYHPEAPAHAEAPVAQAETPVPHAEAPVEHSGAHTEILYKNEGVVGTHTETTPVEKVTPAEFEALKQQQNAAHSAVAPEASSGVQTAAESVVNSHNLEVITSEPHIYADDGAKHLLVYGGSPADQTRLVGEFFQNPDNANAVVYTADQTNTYRIPWTNTGGEVTLGSPVRTNGFLGFFKSFMKAPDPSEFRAIIK